MNFIFLADIDTTEPKEVMGKNKKRKTKTETSESSTNENVPSTSDRSATGAVRKIVPMKSVDFSAKVPFKSYIVKKTVSGKPRPQVRNQGSSTKMRPSGGKEPDFPAPRIKLLSAILCSELQWYETGHLIGQKERLKR